MAAVRTALLWLCLCWLSCAACARAQAEACDGPFSVAYRTLSLADGREVSVWYPTLSKRPDPALRHREADSVEASPIALCERWPLVLFSHGMAGCATQAVFITEQIASQGYVVAAPNHHDAICGSDTRDQRWRRDSTQPSFLLPGLWDARARRDRVLDLRETLQLVVHDPDLSRAIDVSRIGLMGHSLGGYTVIGMAGGWAEWSMPGVRAVLAFSPYVEPFIAHHRLGQLQVPVMYQGGTLDFGITPIVERDGGAYALSPAPKFFLDLAGATHLAWTDFLCRDTDSVSECLADTPNAHLIDAYALAFLDHYLKDRPEPLLSGHGEGLAIWRAAR
jgi:predicted dienelactone hydrolase